LGRVCAGALEYYDKSYDRVNVKNERPLKRIDRVRILDIYGTTGTLIRTQSYVQQPN
jgi:hypothetical protein